MDAEPVADANGIAKNFRYQIWIGIITMMLGLGAGFLDISTRLTIIETKLGTAGIDRYTASQASSRKEVVDRRLDELERDVRDLLQRGDIKR